MSNVQGKVVQNQPFDEAVELSSSECALRPLNLHFPIPFRHQGEAVALQAEFDRTPHGRSVDEVPEAQDDKKAVPRRGSQPRFTQRSADRKSHAESRSIASLKWVCSPKYAGAERRAPAGRHSEGGSRARRVTKN